MYGRWRQTTHAGKKREMRSKTEQQTLFFLENTFKKQAETESTSITEGQGPEALVSTKDK